MVKHLIFVFLFFSILWKGKINENIFDFKIGPVPGNMLTGHGSKYFYLLMHANTNLYNIQNLFFLISLGFKLYVRLLFDLTFLFIKMAFIYPASVSNVLLFLYIFFFPHSFYKTLVELFHSFYSTSGSGFLDEFEANGFILFQAFSA